MQTPEFINTHTSKRGAALLACGIVLEQLVGCSTVSADTSAASLHRVIASAGYDSLATDRWPGYVAEKISVGEKCIGEITTIDDYPNDVLHVYVRTNPDFGDIEVDSFKTEHDALPGVTELLARPLIARSCVVSPAGTTASPIG
jgi:hypothetical protein